MKLALRNYQEQALESEKQHRLAIPEETRLAVVMATGLGKGQIIAFRAVRAIEDPMFSGRVLILTHTDELVADLAARCRLVAGQSEFPITVGIVKAEQDEPEADIVVASTQTLLSPERRVRITDVGLVLVDECELYAAPQWKGILEHFGCMREWGKCSDPDCYGGCNEEYPTPALGFTATLERGDRQGLGELWQDVCFSRDISWGVRHGYLVQPVGHRLEIELNGELGGATSFEEGMGNLTALDIQMAESVAPEKIVEKWIELAKGRPTVAFMPLVRSATALMEAFWSAGISAGVIHGAMSDRERRGALRNYDSGHFQVLCNAMVLTRGWDSPRTKCVIVGRPTKSRALGIQMAGRGLRPVPGVPVEDQDCLLIYVQDATSDLFSHADLSDRPLERTAQGALTVMEDQWDIGKSLDTEPEHVWSGHVNAKAFDPLVQRSSKVWRTTKTSGTPFLTIGDKGQYVFVVGTSVYFREPDAMRGGGRWVTKRLHADLPDLELALSVAEDEAQERGGDLGRMLADRDRPWRKRIPSTEMQEYAQRLGLGKELISIMESTAGGKAGKLSDLIGRIEATRALEPMVAKIKERVGES
jgi:superfamily II DNA or RNA helicase